MKAFNNFFIECFFLIFVKIIKPMKIKITDFATRHFDPKFGGTKILDKSIEEFQSYIDEYFKGENLTPTKPIFIDGYAPFCKLVAIKNFTDAKVGSLPITLENYQYLRSGYSARRESELPVFSRWFELPLSAPKAEYLMLVLYSKEQIDKENKENPDKIFYDDFDADWGVVAILGQSHPNEEKMKPETMIRNSMGIEYGGSGVPLDKEEYLKSVTFWSENATVKT